MGEVRDLFRISHAGVTKHLKVLERTGLIRRRWSGRQCYPFGTGSKRRIWVFRLAESPGKKTALLLCIRRRLSAARRKKSRMHIEDGQRFGLHNLCNALSNWLVNKAKVHPRTVQGILRHSKIQTTLDLYPQEVSDETRAAQGEFLTTVGMNQTVH